MLAFIPDYLVVFEYAASDIPPLCFQRGGQGVSKIGFAPKCATTLIEIIDTQDDA